MAEHTIAHHLATADRSRTGAFHQRYQAGTSPLHRLDPRVKVVMTLALILGILLTPERAWPAYPLLWALVGSLALVGHFSPWRQARLAGLALPFALTAVTLTVTVPGHPVAHVLGWAVTDAGLARFISIVIKSWLSVQVALLLSMTTPIPDLLWAFNSLRMPPTLTAIVGFMVRYLDILRDEVQRLTIARASRSASLPGHKAGGTLLWRAKTTGGMVGSLFLRSYERSERVYAAMQARGYNGALQRLDAPAIARRDILWGALPIVALLLIEVLALLIWAR